VPSLAAAGALARALAGTVTPSPIVTTNPNPNIVSPGWAGFVVTFLLAVAVILLVRSMTKHLRKVRYTPDPSDPSDPRRSVDHLQRTRNVVDDQGVDPRGD
jgi:hypothetical protein